MFTQESKRLVEKLRLYCFVDKAMVDLQISAVILRRTSLFLVSSNPL